MWSKLEKPFQLAGIGIERKNAVRIEVITWPRCPVEVRRRITGSPVNGIEFRIEGTRHPSRAAPAQIQFAGPTFRADFSRSWNGPEAPCEFPRLDVKSCEKASDAVVAAGSANQTFVLDDERCARRAIIPVALSIGHIPKQMARACIEAKQMGVVGLKINMRMPHSNAPIVMLRGIVYESLANRP